LLCDPGYLQELSNLQVCLFESCGINSWNPKDRTAGRSLPFPIGKFENHLSFANATEAYYGNATVTVWRNFRINFVQFRFATNETCVPLERHKPACFRRV